MNKVVNVFSHAFVLGNTIDLNSGKRVEWFCSAEIEAEVKTHVCTRNNFIPSSFQELHTKLQKFECWTYLASRKYILISPDGEMECTQVFLVI